MTQIIIQNIVRRLASNTRKLSKLCFNFVSFKLTLLSYNVYKGLIYKVASHDDIKCGSLHVVVLIRAYV